MDVRRSESPIVDRRALAGFGEWNGGKCIQLEIGGTHPKPYLGVHC